MYQRMPKKAKRFVHLASEYPSLIKHCQRDMGSFKIAVEEKV
jgi:hypothetical protein